MTVADIPIVQAIDQAAFGLRWSKSNYQHELELVAFAHYFVVLLGHEMIGTGGIWMVLEQAHVTNIAVHPNWQRQGWGAWILERLLRESQKLGAEEATLEVRPSNVAAQTLYDKFGFVEMGRRKRYYPDGEDGLILTTPKFSDLPSTGSAHSPLPEPVEEGQTRPSQC